MVKLDYPPLDVVGWHGNHAPYKYDLTNYNVSDLAPEKLAGTMAFMFETRYPLIPTEYASSIPALQDDYPSVWHSLERHFEG